MFEYPRLYCVYYYYFAFMISAISEPVRAERNAAKLAPCKITFNFNVQVQVRLSPGWASGSSACHCSQTIRSLAYTVFISEALYDLNGALGMRALRPLPKHPEFTVFDTPNICREYRIKSRHLARRVEGVGGAHNFPIRDMCVVLFLAVLWPMVRGSTLLV